MPTLFGKSSRKLEDLSRTLLSQNLDLQTLLNGLNYYEDVDLLHKVLPNDRIAKSKCVSRLIQEGFLISVKETFPTF